MRIISRIVVTSRSTDEVTQILKNASSIYRPIKLVDNCFELAFPIRWHRNPGILPVKGTIEHKNGFTEVKIEIHSGLVFRFIMALLLIAFLISVYGLLFQSASVYQVLAIVGVGILVYVLELFDGITCLDSLEHRLTRKLDE